MENNCGGQTALLDSIFFLALMLLASSIVISAMGKAHHDTEKLGQYTEDFTETLLAVEIGERNTPVSEYLCGIALVGGPENHTNDMVVLAGNNHIRPGLAYAVDCQCVFLSDFIKDPDDLPDSRYASQRIYNINGEQVILIVYIWVI